MLVKMKNTSAGPDGVRMADGIYEIPDKEAKTIIKAGYAKEVDAEDADDSSKV